MWKLFKRKKVELTKNNNVVNQLHIHRDDCGIWWFNDEDLGILHEVFVGDINLMIDIYAKERKHLIVNISEYSMPNYTNVLIQTEAEDVYELSGTEITGWLCKCLLCYFKDYPDFLYFEILQ